MWMPRRLVPQHKNAVSSSTITTGFIRRPSKKYLRTQRNKMLTVSKVAFPVPEQIKSTCCSFATTIFRASFQLLMLMGGRGYFQLSMPSSNSHFHEKFSLNQNPLESFIHIHSWKIPNVIRDGEQKTGWINLLSNTVDSCLWPREWEEAHSSGGWQKSSKWEFRPRHVVILLRRDGQSRRPNTRTYSCSVLL